MMYFCIYTFYILHTYMYIYIYMYVKYVYKMYIICVDEFIGP